MSNKEKEPMFSAKNMKLLTNPLGSSNPITVQILGICSALAVTAKLQPAFVMALSVTVVTAFSNLILSLLRKGIPSRIRIIVQLVVVAALVILVDQMLKAFVYDVSKQLSVFVGLIITNCIVMGRIEAFALVILGFVRELLGAGTVWGYRVIPESFYAHGYSNNGLMLLPPMALICVGIIIWIHRSHNRNLCE